MSRPKAIVPTMPTSVVVVPADWFRLKQLALDERVSVSALVRDAVHDFLAKHDGKDRAVA
jgi:hypothetical protein